MSDLRNRKPGQAAPEASPSSRPTTPSKKSKPSSLDDLGGEVDSGISLLDIVRVILGALFISSTFSWFVTDGESLIWGYKPKALRWNTLKGLFRTPIVLTDAELSLYNGSDPTKPIYVAINGSVFDVSAAPQTYGPGGGYSFFSGRDAARAFVSGCFGTDLTWDLRGLEEQFISGKLREEDNAELAEIEELERKAHGEYHEGEKYQGRVRYLKRRREKRRKEAWEKVIKAVNHWERFFGDHEKYFYVGKVVHPDLSGEPIRELCQQGKGKP